MAFAAKWAGRCKNPFCKGAYSPGDNITKDPAYGWVHVACYQPRKRSNKIPKKERQMGLPFKKEEDGK